MSESIETTTGIITFATGALHANGGTCGDISALEPQGVNYYVYFFKYLKCQAKITQNKLLHIIGLKQELEWRQKVTDYRKRIADKILKEKLDAFGATLIDGPKGCGKTTTAKQTARTVVEFEDEEVREGLLGMANTMPSMLLKGETPILFDEWQDAPKIWGAVRKSVDDLGGSGMYILTGSSSRFVDTPHTGTGRISTMTMLPLSLYESGESNGQVSLHDLFDNPGDFDGCVSDLSVEELIYAICRGGWPRAVFETPADRQLLIAKDMFTQIYRTDISRIDNTRRNPDTARVVLQSYARNVCSLAQSIYGDVMQTIR